MKNRGMSLIEVLLVVAAVGFLILLLGNLPNSIKLVGYSGHQSLAREIAIKAIEDTRALPYANLANGSFTLADPRISSLPSGFATKLIEDCSLTICTQGEIAKQVAITISWKEGPDLKNVNIETIIAEGGLN